jgi:TPP-dependent pyruvate/acetoin dehydrogenase alpha subunit
LFAEMMGKSTGVCGGRGGSQHLHWKRFYSNGIQGGFVPIAVGMGLAIKKRAQESIVINFIGDGTLGEGVLYEGLNIASLWGIPILFILENNRIAQTTPVELAVSGDIQSRFKAFDITCSLLETSDVREILPVAEELINSTREFQKPHALVLNTHRFGPHSKGDDTRSQEEISRLIKQFDPIAIEQSRWDQAVIQKIDAETDSELIAAFNQSHKDPVPVL